MGPAEVTVRVVGIKAGTLLGAGEDFTTDVVGLDEVVSGLRVVGFASIEVVCLVVFVGFDFDVVRFVVVDFGVGADVFGLKVLSFMMVAFRVEVDVDNVLGRDTVVCGSPATAVDTLGRILAAVVSDFVVEDVD